MEETGIYDIEDEIMMSIFYKGIHSNEDIVFHVMENEQVSVKVKYDCGEEILEGILNMEPVASAQHPDMYAMMVGLLNIHCTIPPTVSTEVKKEDTFYYDYYQSQMVSIDFMKIE